MNRANRKSCIGFIVTLFLFGIYIRVFALHVAGDDASLDITADLFVGTGLSMRRVMSSMSSFGEFAAGCCGYCMLDG